MAGEALIPGRGRVTVERHTNVEEAREKGRALVASMLFHHPLVVVAVVAIAAVDLRTGPVPQRHPLRCLPKQTSR